MAQADNKWPKFARKFVACALGGMAAGFAAPVVCVYAGSMVVASIAAGAIASTVSTVADNLQQDTVEIRYHPYQAQQAFRDAITNFLDNHFEPIFRAIQRNHAADFGPTRLEIRTEDAFRALGFANTDSTTVSFEFEFRVRPRPGTAERDIVNSVSPPALQNHTDPQAVAPYPLPPSFACTLHSAFDGIGWSALRGVAVGAVGAVCTPLLPFWDFIETAPGVAGLVVGMPSISAAGAAAVELGSHSSPLERVALGVNFAAELKAHVNRVAACAQANDVDLYYATKAGVRRKAKVFGDEPDIQGEEWTQLWYEDRSSI